MLVLASRVLLSLTLTNHFFNWNREAWPITVFLWALLALLLYHRIKKSKTVFFTQICSWIFVSLRWWVRLLPAFLSGLLLLSYPSQAGNRHLYILKVAFGVGEVSSFPRFLHSATHQTTSYPPISNSLVRTKPSSLQ